MTRDYLAPEFRAASGLRYLIGFGVYGLALSGLYAATGIGLPCPLRWATGWECPLCGATRMGSSLLHLDLRVALSYNPVALVGLIVLSTLGVLWTIEICGGPSVRPPRRVAYRLRLVHPTRWLVIALAAGLGYSVLRNLL